jgi:hypothetical protein
MLGACGHRGVVLHTPETLTPPVCSSQQSRCKREPLNCESQLQNSRPLNCGILELQLSLARK